MQETVYQLRCPVTVAVVSDLHDRPYDAVLRSLQRRRPDMICIPGDLFDGSHSFNSIPASLRSPHALPFLTQCVRIAPCFLSLGNHEWVLREADFRLMREIGVQVLDNTWTKMGGVCIGGLTSAHVKAFQRLILENNGRFPRREYGRRFDLQPDLSWLPAFEAQPGYRILLSHHPEYWQEALRGRSIDLVISGHAHGGQIRLFRQGLFAPGQGFFPKYTAGVYGNLVVSRGLANTGAPVPRLWNAPELVYLEPLP